MAKRKFYQGVWSIVRAGLLAYLAVLLMLMWFETQLIYPAPRYPVGDWDSAKTHAWEDVHFASADGTKLHGWYRELKTPPRAYLLYCHGNGENVAYLGEYLAWLADKFELTVFVFDYRGYGRSEGSPAEVGILADGDAAQKWFAERAKIKPQDIVLMGRSLGGGVAVDLAARNGARGLILQNTFTSMPDAAAYHYPWAPVRWLMKNRYNNLERIANYSGPLLQSHGDADTVVPFALGQKLHAAAIGPKQFYVSKGLDHNNGDTDEYREILGQFLNSLPPPPQTAAEPSSVNAAGE